MRQYTEDRVSAALNRAADDLYEFARHRFEDSHIADDVYNLADLMVNTTMTYLSDPGAESDLARVAKECYQNDDWEEEISERMPT